MRRRAGWAFSCQTFVVLVILIILSQGGDAAPVCTKCTRNCNAAANATTTTTTTTSTTTQATPQKAALVGRPRAASAKNSVNPTPPPSAVRLVDSTVVSTSVSLLPPLEDLGSNKPEGWRSSVELDIFAGSAAAKSRTSVRKVRDVAKQQQRQQQHEEDAETELEMIDELLNSDHHDPVAENYVSRRVCPGASFQIELLLIPLSIALIPASICALLLCTFCCGPKDSRGKMPQNARVLFGANGVKKISDSSEIPDAATRQESEQEVEERWKRKMAAAQKFVRRSQLQQAPRRKDGQETGQSRLESAGHEADAEPGDNDMDGEDSDELEFRDGCVQRKTSKMTRFSVAVAVIRPPDDTDEENDNNGDNDDRMSPHECDHSDKYDSIPSPNPSPRPTEPPPSPPSCFSDTSCSSSTSSSPQSAISGRRSTLKKARFADTVDVRHLPPVERKFGSGAGLPAPPPLSFGLTGT